MKSDRRGKIHFVNKELQRNSKHKAKLCIKFLKTVTPK